MRDHFGVGVTNFLVCFVLLFHLLFWRWLRPERWLYSLSVPVTHSRLFLAVCSLISRLGEIQSNFETRSFISSTNLGIFIGDLVSSPTTTSDLLPHQFPGHRQVRLWKRLSYIFKNIYVPKMDTHGLTSSLSCVAEAPSDTQLEQPTGGSASPPLLGSAQTEAESRHRHLSAFQQSWKSIRRGDFNIFINYFGLWGLKSDCKKNVLTSDHTQHSCATQTDTGNCPSPA